jgi:predicted GNAT superfamily acetyltransferase
MRARNAHFNLNRLGVVVEAYCDNFYGTDYGSDYAGQIQGAPGIDSDRLFASWYLRSERVKQLAAGQQVTWPVRAEQSVVIPADWPKLVNADPKAAKQQLLRVREEFKAALSSGLVCAGFERDEKHPAYLFYDRDKVMQSPD